MKRLQRKALFLVLCLMAGPLLSPGGGLAAQNPGEPPPQDESAAAEEQDSQTPDPGSAETRPQGRAVPHVTGTVQRWNGNRIDLKTRAGKVQKVAVNEDTEQLVEIKPGLEVTVEYHRKISGFVIAERVLPAREEEAPSGADTAKGTVAGSVVSWNNAALVLKTEAGDVTLSLSPRTEYLVKSLEPGLQVTVDYREISGQGRLATRVSAAGKDNGSE